MKATNILLACFAVMALGFLAGCANHDAYDHQACLNLGVQYGTPEYVNCRVGAAQIREQRRANRLSYFGTLMNYQAQQQQLQQRSRGVTCYTTANATRCY